MVCKMHSRNIIDQKKIMETYESVVKSITDNSYPVEAKDLSDSENIMILGTNSVYTQTELIKGLKSYDDNIDITVIAQPGIARQVDLERSLYDKTMIWDNDYNKELFSFISDRVDRIDAFVFRGLFNDLRNRNIIDIASLLQKKYECKIYQYQSVKEIIRIIDASKYGKAISDYIAYNDQLESRQIF